MLSRFTTALKSKNSLVCVGLDPDPDKVPNRDLLAFNRQVVDASAPFAACYKLQLGFYEMLGHDGLRQMGDTVEYIRRTSPATPIIGDAKRCDVPNSAKAYAKALFGIYKFDAVTVTPYVGWDGIEPFLEYDGGVFVLCHTSNPSASDIQELQLKQGRTVYEHVAAMAVDQGGDRIGLVVGATYPSVLATLRQQHPQTLFLAPGVGAQGADLKKTVEAGTGVDGGGLLISSSRAVIYAPDPGLACRVLRDKINSLRHQELS